MEDLNWHTILVIYGPLGAFAALCAMGVIRYFPRVIESHLQFTEAVKAQGERTTAAVESLATLVRDRLTGNGAEFRDHSFSTHRTNAALSHLADAIQAGAHEVGGKFDESMRSHVSGMKDALTKRELP